LELISYVTIGGTIAFAASGALAGIRKGLDIFGVTVVAFVTSIGGGTLRDILLGKFPIKWLFESQILLLIVVVSVITVFFRKYIIKQDKTLLLFDTIGLAFFTVKGLEAGIDMGLGKIACIILATVTASFGGVVRDIVLNEIPAIFHKEIYATAVILGCVFYYFLAYFNLQATVIQNSVIVLIILIRLLAVVFNISLPKILQNQ
jgi:uncharacterized membrane protein YeiH